MKQKLITFAALLLVLFLLVATVASASTPYKTYTYSYDGEAMESPDAYKPTKFQISGTNMSTETVQVPYDGKVTRYSDLCSDKRGYVYIVDKGLNQVIVLNPGYKAEFVIDRFDSDVRRDDTFNAPTGIYVSDDAIYVCDTDNSRIVVFDLDGTYRRIVTRPQSAYFGENSVFTPIACVADRYGRMFIISRDSYQGVIVMDDAGNFTGFIGAQKVSYSAFELFFRRFQSEAEREATSRVTINYDNITIDENGFIYVVSTSIDEDAQKDAITTKSSDYSPVKKLNAKGDEIMSRNGFFDCGGEVNVSKLKTASARSGVSKICDVAAGPEGSWSIIDRRRSKTFTYDANGNLLFAFGDSGEQIGNISLLSAIDYQYDSVENTHNLLLLDSTRMTVTVFSRSGYGDLLIEALRNDNERKYSESIIYWQKILEANNNFDAAYIGVGKALYNNGEFAQAREYLSAAHETTYYAKALSAERQQMIADHPIFTLLIVVGVIVLIVLFLKLMGYAKRLNYAGNFKSKHTYWEELMYAFYSSFHPFDGFWDIKHEGRGSLRGGLTIVGITVLAFYYQSIGRSYLANPTGTFSTILVQLAAVVVPLLLWAIANWCLTTLFDGEARFREVFVTACYALAPLPWFLVISTIFTNISTTANDTLATLIVTLGYVWVAFLLFFGTLTVQGYSLGKNLVTTVATVFGMAIIMFVVILFASLIGDMASFVSNIVTEISYRA